MHALLTDLYQFSMLEAYLEEGMDEPADFELFVRQLPPQRNYLVAAGLDSALDHLERLTFAGEELEWLKRQGFSPRLVDRLASMRFTGDVHAMPEGTPFFANEPILRVSAPLQQAQLVESRLLNIVHFQTLAATKAARMVHVARGRTLVDFGFRRAHGAEAGVWAARASYLTGFAGTATALAGLRHGIPVFGTMAHSFVQAHASEREAFEAFARTRPQRPTLLVDTYDTEAAVETIIALAPALAVDGIRIGGVRLDSGDLAAHARAVRSMLDAAGLRDVSIFASGNVDEHRIEALLAAGAPIDGFGVGTALVTSSDVPAIDAVYKLQRYAGRPRRKRSEGKATWPGVKQVWREFGADGVMRRDRVCLADEAGVGEPLLVPVMRNGQRLDRAPSLDELRLDHARQIGQLPPDTAALARAAPYPVDLSPAIVRLARELDARPR